MAEDRRASLSAIGREFTLTTNQVDFAVPKRFGLTYADKDNTDKTRYASTARLSARTNDSSASSSSTTAATSLSGSRPFK